MARPAYSTLIVTLGPLGAGELVEVGGPAVGFLWVIRDIVAVSPAYGLDGDSGPLDGLTVFDSDGIPIASWLRPWLQNTWPYHWQGRQVVPYGMVIYVQSQDNGWSCRISGYTLSD
jgi:hypothetical protein